MAGDDSACGIRHLPEARLWVLSGGEMSYVLGVNEREELQHVYWGRRIWRDADWGPAAGFPQWDGVDPSTNTTPEEYPGWGGLRFFEPCLKAVLPDGGRDLVLKVTGHDLQGRDLTIHLRDLGCDLVVELHYHLDPPGILSKWATIRNGTGGTVVLESAQSGTWHLPQGQGYHLDYLSGRWGEETRPTREEIHPGSKVLESRRGSTSNQMNPWFAIEGPGEDATEEHGDVWFGALGWSGSWKLVVEQTPRLDIRVTGGMSDFDFAYPLAPGESFTTPPFHAGFTAHGMGQASRIFHRFQLERILPRASAGRLRPVLYNSWEATGFDVDQAGQMALAEKAARIGVERFVMDDGWFGARDSSRAGLGDWRPSPRKFPEGLKPLIEHVKALGMDFGLWVEPEMVNPDSDLYRAHPDWVLHFPGRPRSEARNQLVLNLSRDDVKEFVFTSLDTLLSGNEIAFLKWDLNRNFAEPGWPAAPVTDKRRIWVDHVRHVYEIIDRLRSRHPGLEIESCASGGGRVDLGILTRTEQVWPSDNTDAFDRLSIQEGFSLAYTPKVMMAWVTDVPTLNGRVTSLEYRFLVAMSGSLGIGANLLTWNDEEMALAGRMIALYKSIRGMVQEGDLFRLLSPRKGWTAASQYVSRDGRQAVLFAFSQTSQFGREVPAIKLRGLDERAVYRMQSVNGRLDGPAELSGAALMHRGLRLNLKGDYDGTAVLVERLA